MNSGAGRHIDHDVTGPQPDEVVKGLTKLWSRLHHGREAKSVDAGPSESRGRLLPNDSTQNIMALRSGRAADLFRLLASQGTS